MNNFRKEGYFMNITTPFKCVVTKNAEKGYAIIWVVVATCQDLLDRVTSKNAPYHYSQKREKLVYTDVNRSIAGIICDSKINYKTFKFDYDQLMKKIGVFDCKKDDESKIDKALGKL